MTGPPELPGAGPPRPVTAFGRGLLRRCARCGGGDLFERWFTMRERCPTCGLRFEREEGFFLGAFVVNFAVTEAVLALFIALAVVLTLPDPPLPFLAGLAVVVTVVVPLIFYPWSKTIWTAVDVLMQRM